MTAKKRRNFTGTFLAQDRGGGAWHLLRSSPHEIDIYLQGAEDTAQRAFGNAALEDLGIEWRPGGALLTFLMHDKVSTVAVRNAIVHEPLPRLYDALPLEVIDAAARRFWRRIFRLVRIPGGRYLLNFIARSSRR